MANFILCGCLFRVALPLLILTCVSFRPSFLSAIYLILLLYSAIVPVPTPKSMAGHTGIYLKVMIAISMLGFLLQLAFQIVLLSIPPYGHFLINCEMPETILTYCGFVRLDAASGITITTWIAPEIVMTITSIGIFVFSKKLTVTNAECESELGELPQKTKPKRHSIFWVALGKYMALISLCMAAVLRPSILGGFYFLIFIGSCTWWACYKELQRGFAIVCRIVMVFVFLHICSLYGYQFDWAQQQLNATGPYARYLGLTPLFNTSCDNPRDVEWMSMNWDGYANPLALIWLFYILAIVSKNLLKPRLQSQKKPGAFARFEGSINGPINRQMSQRLSERRLLRAGTSRHRWQSATRKVRLMRGVSPSRKYGASSKRTHGNVLQDSTGSVTVTGENPDDIPLQSLEDEEEKPGCFENTVFILESILQFIVQSSYVATNIIMMTWSITYHSWLTFVLLLWANILWMLPSQRKSTLRSSPFLVFYATFLLISAYIYCMDIDELPSEIYGISLEQIGFNRIHEFPCHSLLIKCLFTIMFWITLRQHVREIKEARQSHTLADMAAPLQVTVGAATGVTKEQEKETQLLKNVGEYLKKFFTRFWIWVVAITLFAVAITGERMTGFRILYMALFLFFIISFQLSFRIWMKMMFAFWLTVIIYSMIILILVYTYQFDNFDEYWTKYLHVPKEQQLDIGLEKYGPTQLFVRLATPTFFVIVTVVQLHYFHKDFMILSTPSEPPAANPTSEDDSSAQGKVLEQKHNDDTDKSDITSLKIDLTDIGNVSTEHIKYKLAVFWNKLYKAINFVFVLLEIHMHKFVLLMAILMSIYDKCALYILVVLFVVLGITTSRKMQMFVVYASSIFASLLLLARMVFQIQYIQYDTWNVTCSNINMTGNNAEWLGFRKTISGRDLPKLVQWNIAYVSAVTLYTVVLVRQFNHKLAKGRPTTRLFFMFPGISRFDADKNLQTCLKYLANYGYYKYGIEISFMATVALIGFRMDMYALLYAIWLTILFALSRERLAKIWSFYMGFIAIFIPIQYVMVIGLPPGLCTDFPWDRNILLGRFQNWAFLMDYVYPPPAKKLIFDIILLLLVSRQAVVFRIERRYKNEEYPGGSNESIIHHAEENQFVNPVPDFITFTRSYLDVAKRIILLGFMWLTLAIVFLAGANRVNIFSVGYLIGSFVFLWQGSDIYLKPIPAILKSWNCLLGYNVTVILCKTILQFFGCVYLDDITDCSVVQLLGIGCVRKFTGVGIPEALYDDTQCPLPKEYIGLVWDGICFGFLIMQRRIFCSYNFFHMIDETKATTILASRGAELIEQLRDKRMHEQDEQERRILEKIKAKMDRIKATQQKIQGPDYKSTASHYADHLYPNSRPLYRRKQPNSYKEAIRSGDYYMFDELDDDDDLEMIEELKPEEEEDDEEETKLKRAASAKRTLGEIEESPHRSDRSGRLKIEDTEPRPGTSKDEELSDITEPKDSKCQKVLDILIFLWTCIDSLMVSLINYFNRFSKDYRYVVRVLRKEKKLLKQTADYTQGIRMGRGQVWQPAGSYHTLLQRSRPEQQMIIPKLEEDDIGELSSYDQPTVVRLVLTIWYIILSHSDILCYFVIFLNQIKSATFLSLPLPLMVFLWGTLTVPRPSKNFWVTIIAYTQMIVLIKCLFQFKFLPWNKDEFTLNPMSPARLFGVERKENYAVWDLLLLLIVFFHRYLLKCLGLWKTTAVIAPVYSEGIYTTEEGDIYPLKKGRDPSPFSSDGSSQKFKNVAINERKNSDLQRLVEESEDAGEDQAYVEHTDHIEFSDLDNVVSVEVKNTTPYDMFPDTLHMTTSKYLEAIKDFFIQLKDPSSRVAVDVYSYMFMCDFFNFFVILIGYSSFGTQQGDGGVSSYLEDNRVPILFLLMLILQFTLILVDRAIFLRKNIIAKIIFQFVQIIVLHIWLFVIFPAMTERAFNSVLPPQMYYMVKSFYLLLSAYQIRCGYPSRILGNFLCKSYNYLNMFLFKGFMLIPFLFELRTVMDWMWTDTSMTVFDWIKMEDIFAHIFQLKCTRHMESEYPQPRGERKSPRIKYLMGGAILFILVAIIWFPLVFFSLGNAVGQPNPPTDVTLDIRIGPYEPVYHLSAQSNSIFQFKQQDLKDLMSVYKNNKGATAFMSNYEGPDIAAIKLSRDSSNVWSISPPDRDRMIAEVNSTNGISIRLQYVVTHASNNKDVSGVIREERLVIMEAMIDNKPNPERQKLLHMLDSNRNESIPPVILDYIMPKFLKVTNRGTALPLSQMMNIVDDDIRTEELRRLKLILSKSVDNPELEWWEIGEICTDNNYLAILEKIPYNDCDSIMLYTFNDRIFPETLNVITAGGIIGLYTTLVFVASRVLRGFFTEICFKIMFDDMPNVDRVLQLCLDIYLVREAREFCLEEDLFAKLVFLFRSPETLIKWTRPKEELADDEDPEGEPE